MKRKIKTDCEKIQEKEDEKLRKELENLLFGEA